MRSNTLLLISFLAFTGQGAFAQTCDQLVVDYAGVLGDIGKLEGVERAVQEVRATGQDAYVRIYKNIGTSSNIERFTRELAASCPAWQNAKGGYKSNLFVMVLAVENRKVNIGAGESIDQQASVKVRDRILAQYTAPLFRDGDWAGGFVAALEHIKPLLEQSTRPTATSEPSQEPASNPAPPQQPQTLADWSGFWTFFKWFTGIVVGGMLLIFAGKKIRQYGTTRREYLEARNKLQEAKLAAASAIADAPNTYEFLLSRAQHLHELAGTDRSQKLLEKIRVQKEIMDTAIQQYNDPAENANPATAQECNDLRKKYQDMAETLKQIGVELASIESRIADYETEIKQAPEQIRQARQALENARTEVDRVRIQGYRVDGYIAKLSMASGRLNDAEAALTAKKFDELAQSVADANALINQAMVAASLPKTDAGLQTQIVECENRARTIRQNVIDTKAVFDRLFALYAERSWQSVKGNGTQASEHLNWCAKALPLARTAIGKGVQDWQRGAELVKEARDRLDKAEALIKSIPEMEESLFKAKAGAAGDLLDAEQALLEAERFENQFDADFNDSERRRLADAWKTLEQAKTESGTSKPEYFLVLKLAKQAHESADQILAQCRTEHKSAERLRDKATKTLRDARGRVSKAEQYHKVNANQVSAKSRAHLKDALTWLDNAEKAKDPAEILRWAEKADDSGEKAYKQAINEQPSYPSSSSRARNSSARSSSSSYGTTILVNNQSWGSPVDVVTTPSRSHDSDYVSSSSSSSGGSDSSINFGGGGGSDSSISVDFGSSSSGTDASVGF